MKKILAALLIGLLMLGLVACGSESKDTPKTPQVNEDNETEKAEEIEKTEENTISETSGEKVSLQEDPEIEKMKSLVKEMFPTIVFKEPKYEGEYPSGLATFENLLDLPVIYYSAKGFLKEGNIPIELNKEFTVLPGEKSPNIVSPWPKTDLAEDIIINSLTLYVQREDRSIIHFEYDVELDLVDVQNRVTREESDVDVSGLIPVIKFIDPEYELEETKVEGLLKNTTDLTIKLYRIDFFVKESNQLGSIFCYDEVLPGESSTSIDITNINISNIDNWDSTDRQELANNMDYRFISVTLTNDDGDLFEIGYDMLLKTSTMYKMN
ncbi:MAG: hypothetical protein GX046_02470 [Tissierellia bacterium]|nr:hypothetical protein [Tissierellia bacterium]